MYLLCSFKIVHIDSSCFDEDEFSMVLFTCYVSFLSVWLWWIHDIFHRCMCILTFHVCESMFMLHFTIHEWISKVLEENEVKCVIYLSYKTKNLDDSNEIFNQCYLAKYYHSNSFYEVWNVFGIEYIWKRFSFGLDAPKHLKSSQEKFFPVGESPYVSFCQTDVKYACLEVFCLILLDRPVFNLQTFTRTKNICVV